jgi:hypothetical protein
MLRDLIDSTRESMIDSDLMPTRQITYTRASTEEVLDEIEAYVGAGQFNKEEKETLENRQSFGGLKLSFRPNTGDLITYGGQTFTVERSDKLGALYIVYCSQVRHSSRGIRR